MGAANENDPKGIDYKGILAEIRENSRKLAACKRHTFSVSAPLRLGHKMTCVHCGGQMNIVDIGYYIDGYEAAGGDADDVWHGYHKSREERRARIAAKVDF